MAPKKMKTKAVLLCESCEIPIMRAEDGFIVYGAISLAEPNAEALVGVVFPSKGSVDVQELSTTAFCRACFAKKLGLRSSVPRTAAPASVSHSVEANGEPLGQGEPTPYSNGEAVDDPGFEVVDPLHAKTATSVQTSTVSGRVLHVGAVKEVAPGAHVNAGVGVLPTNAANLPIIPGPIVPGSIVRVNQNHPNFQALRGRAAQVERFREKERDFVFRFAGGQPMLGNAAQLDKIG
jgi:hypothetical protein